MDVCCTRGATTCTKPSGAKASAAAHKPGELILSSLVSKICGLLFGFIVFIVPMQTRRRNDYVQLQGRRTRMVCMTSRSHLLWVIFEQLLPRHQDGFRFTYAFAEAAAYQAEERLCHPNPAILIAFIDLAGADFQASAAVIA